MAMNFLLKSMYIVTALGSTLVLRVNRPAAHLRLALSFLRPLAYATVSSYPLGVPASAAAPMALWSLRAALKTRLLAQSAGIYRLSLCKMLCLHS